MKAWQGLGKVGTEMENGSSTLTAGCKDALVYLIKVGGKHFCQTVDYVYEWCHS